MKEINFINKISVGTQSDFEPILLNLEIPTKDENKLIVLSGKNRSGKSHIINHVYRSIKEHNKGGAKQLQDGFTPRRASIAVSLSDSSVSCDGVYLINDLDFVLKKFTYIPMNDGRRTNDESGNIENICRKALLCFISFHLHGKFKSEFSCEEWRSSREYRENFCKRLDGKKLYKCNAECEVTNSLEKITDGHLYYRYNNITGYIELHLRYCDGQVFPNPSWSQGQRALFFYLCFICHTKINIFLVDEIESYLHPEYISFLCEKIKEKIPQSIVTTHHPHVIFSKLVDQCWYIELDKSNNKKPENTIDFDERSSAIFPSFSRSIENLSSEFSKISMTYKLFDGYDNNLLRLSQSNSLALSQSVIKSFSKAFAQDIAKSKASNKPDVQNDKLADFIMDLISDTDHRRLEVLDLGAGYGRTFFEISKIHSLKKRIKWSFWEPFEDTRDKLKCELNDSNPAIEVIEIKANILSSYYDLVVISNVLHECNPDLFADYINIASKACKKNGCLIVIELYPLLHPEKYAVPYTEESMKFILRKSGFNTESSSINIKNSSINAYWVKAVKNGDDISVEHIKNSVLERWDYILNTTCGDYKGKSSITKPEHVVQVMGELTTIASIQSYKCGEWR